MTDDIFHIRSSIGGVEMRHSFSSLFVIDRVLDSSPNLRGIIELGTWKGGLSGFLAFQAVCRSVTFQTFDREDIRAPGGYPYSFIQGDVLDSWKIIRRIQHALKSAPYLLYCDNGNKPREAWLYASSMIKGGIIGVHDWPDEIAARHVTHFQQLGFRSIYETLCERYFTRQRFWIKEE